METMIAIVGLAMSMAAMETSHGAAEVMTVSQADVDSSATASAASTNSASVRVMTKETKSPAGQAVADNSRVSHDATVTFSAKVVILRIRDRALSRTELTSTLSVRIRRPASESHSSCGARTTLVMRV